MFQYPWISDGSDIDELCVDDAGKEQSLLVVAIIFGNSKHHSFNENISSFGTNLNRKKINFICSCVEFVSHSS